MCLGDSAAHFAYFRSLNIGLEHASKFFAELTNYPHIKMNLGSMKEDNLKAIIKRTSPLFHIRSVEPSKIPSEYFVSIHVFLYLHGAYSYNIVN